MLQHTHDSISHVSFLPVGWTFVDLGSAVLLFFNRFDCGRIWRLLFRFGHIRGARFGRGGEPPQCGQGRSTIRIQAFGLQLSFCQENFPPLHLFIQLLIVGLGEEKYRLVKEN